MGIEDSQLPIHLNISGKKRLIRALSWLIFFPISFFILNIPGLLPQGLALTQSEGLILALVVIVGGAFVYCLLTPHLTITEKGLTEWPGGILQIPWPYPWNSIETFKVVETNLPIGGASWLLPYKRKTIGIDFKQGLPVDPLSGKPDSGLRSFSRPSKFFLDAQMVFYDVTNLFDKTVYGQPPEDLVAGLNNLRERFSPTTSPVVVPADVLHPAMIKEAHSPTRIWKWVIGTGLFLCFVPLPVALMICSSGGANMDACSTNFLNPFGFSIPLGILTIVVGTIGWTIAKLIYRKK